MSNSSTGVSPIGIGIIGAGNIVKTRHLPGLAAIAGVRVVALHNRRRESAEELAAEWDIPHVDDSPAALLARPEVDAVFIGTPPNLHRELTLAALEAGKHVFCQARMSRNLSEARDMLAAAEAHPDLAAMLCPAPHVLPAQALVREMIASGELGDLRLVRAQHLTESALSPDAPWHWRMDRSVSGYNAMTLGMYAEILHHWVGKARTVQASGRLFTSARPEGRSGAAREVGAPESLAVTGELENGAQYVYTFSSVAAHAPGDMLEIYGTKGALHYEIPTDTLRVGRVQGASQVRVGKVLAKELPPVMEIPADRRGVWRVEADFIAAVRDGAAVFPSFADGADYMEFVEAVGRSIEQERTMHLPLP